MKKLTNRPTLSSLAPLLLFAVFTICILSVLLTGAHIYKNLQSRDRNTFDHRTAVQYLTTRVRQNDRTSGIHVGAFDSKTPSSSGNTLFLSETIEDRRFYTRIYYYDGYLRELFAEEGLNFLPSDGEKILPAADVSFTCSDDLLHIEITFADQTADSLYLKLRSAKEDSP